MGDKKTAKERFLDRFFGVVEDWDKYLTDSMKKNSYLYEAGKMILNEQEDFGNAINNGFGREMWYSNDFFINSLILNNFIANAEGELFNELKQIYVGVLDSPGVNAEALNKDEDFDGYLIKFNFEMELNLTLFCDFVSYHIYGMQISNEIERYNLFPEMVEVFMDLIDKNRILKKFEEETHNDIQVDLKSPRVHIASELFEAGMSFVLGHEIGHHFLKHTESDGRNIVSKLMPKDITSNPLHLDEFAADNFGFDLLIRGMKERNDNTLFAPIIVMLMLALFDKTPEEPSQEHPSLRDRYLNLLRKMSEHNEVVALNLQQIFNEIATWINDALGNHWRTEWWK
ncbi:hypothetical protein CHH83_26270 [Bacillus sp. 7586-K]|uniref:hypothetical protein n=1 Tax=Metabacillus niabensis TaxID=324854 RepID=UPI000BA79A99|nr:hypothetical protein CHH83_26270 [Bacillus sp. 7586-K]